MDSKIDILFNDYNFFKYMELEEFDKWAAELKAYIAQKPDNWKELNNQVKLVRRRLTNKNTSRKIRARNNRKNKQLEQENDRLRTLCEKLQLESQCYYALQQRYAELILQTQGYANLLIFPHSYPDLSRPDFV